MAYKRILVDSFNGATLDISRWTVVQSTGVAQASGTLNLSCVMDYPRVDSKNFFDLSTGIFGAKLTATGTRTVGSEFFIGAHDGAGNHIAAIGAPNGASVTFQPGGLTTFNNEIKTDTTVGVGPSWSNGSWWGIGNMTSDNVIRMYNSRDGQNWNEMSRCTVGGTFNRAHAGIFFKAGIFNGSTTDLVAKFDDASFWTRTVSPSHTAKVRVNGSWAYAEPMTRVGGAWVSSTPKTRDGVIWQAPR